MGGGISPHRLERINVVLDRAARSPHHQWWMGLRDAIGLVSQNTGVLPLEGVPDFGASVSAAATASD